MNGRVHVARATLLALLCACSRGGTPSADSAGARAPFRDANFTGYSGLVEPSAHEYQALEATKMVRSFAPSEAAAFSQLPARVDLSRDLPAARHQGTQQSCTAWAVAFAVKSFQEQREFGWALDDAHLFSPAFVYNQVNGGTDDGAKLLDVLQFVTDHGTVPYAAMPYDEKDFTSQPSAELRTLALRYRGLGYRRLATQDIRQIQAHLAAGDPVIIVVELFADFLPRGMAATQQTYRSTSGASLGRHAVVAVGYDSAKRAFKVLNSWGPEWGDHGYGWIDFALAPQVIKQAFVLYDRPTPPASPTPAAHATPASPAEDARVLLVPDEAGITLAGRWLRLTEPLDHAERFFSAATAPQFRGFHPSPDGLTTNGVRVEPDALGEHKIRKLFFPKTAAFPVSTNLGATFGTARTEVYRMYGAPDFVDAANGGEETYFFHAVASDWGGIQVTQHASLNFRYDAEQRVESIALEAVFKNVKMGQGFQEFSPNERQQIPTGTHIAAAAHPLAFDVPTQFTVMKKSVWDNLGVGYFFNNPQDPAEYLVVKMFDFAEPVTAARLATRIDADLKVYGLTAARATSATFGKVQWSVVDLDQRRYYYAAHGRHIVQLQLASSQPLHTLAWVGTFLQSLTLTE